ncbi:DUF2927 domain-containing protein [Jannaschia sp. CCS1]|uniref:DUF2927 domain-containing protein n=1 Tax=Jannaschia sp. (strain CCS1) TaxID=290400 RepID=UPI00006C0011|nr:DUF2927 domain-containing protein [Jannaschia sp. CCS1]ABD54768.1 lipoprotein putative [Jannaschia sp. CCS1]
MRAPALISLAAALALSACVTMPVETSPRPAPRAEVPDVSATPSELSQSLARYYRSTEARLVGRGLLRTDGGGPDTPFSAEQLAANFERIALYDEYQLVGGRFVARQTPSTLRRWRAPVRVQPHFGASVEAGQQAEDRSALATYTNRLSRVTGHPIRTVDAGGNYHVLFMNADALAASAPVLRELVPSINDATIREIQNMGRLTYCSIFAFSPSGTSEYITAIAVIRDEHPDLMRRSCIHEEIAQGLGLPNDSAAARPSIFNDDEEFALLTRHDELLLRILYDDRLTIGLTPDAARGIVRQIAAELVGGPS